MLLLKIIFYSSEAASSSAPEVEIVFKLHPDMLNNPDQKEVVELMKDNLTRFIKTTTRWIIKTKKPIFHNRKMMKHERIDE